MNARHPAVFATIWSLASAAMHRKSEYDICAVTVRRRKCLSSLMQENIYKLVNKENPRK
jgi:hypothetical protein